MMDAAYFTGRKELLEFFNDLLQLNLTKIEQTASGAVACQLTELIFPGSVPMSRVDWGARSDYEFVQNYKLLQNAFNKHHVQRYVDVDKLCRAKYQDNLEFCQWLKAFYDQSGVYREDYDPVAVRARGKGGKRFNEQHKCKGTRAKPVAARPRPTARAAAPKPKPAAKPAASSSDQLDAPASPNTIRGSRPLRDRESNTAAVEPKQIVIDPNPALVEENEQLKATIEEFEANITTLEEAVLETEQERQFYFNKLRNVEVMMQVYQENAAENDPEELIGKVFKILYAVCTVNQKKNGMS